jgi:hypothetical protein
MRVVIYQGKSYTRGTGNSQVIHVAPIEELNNPFFDDKDIPVVLEINTHATEELTLLELPSEVQEHL